MTKKQRNMIKKFEEITTFKFIVDEIEKGDMTFEQAWNSEIGVLVNMLVDLNTINRHEGFEVRTDVT